MVQINMRSREITLEVVYYRPALSGKTSNLQQLHEVMDPSTRSHMLILDTKKDRTLYFDFLPVEFDAVGGFSIKMKLFTVPGQVMHKSTRKVVQFNKRDMPDVKPLCQIKEQWGDTPTFPAVATRGEGILETFRELMRVLYRGLEARHDFSSKFALSEDEFLKGVMKNFRQSA